MKFVLKFFLLFLSFLILSCHNEVMNIQITSIGEEVNLLTTEQELINLSMNNPEVVDWTLSKEFAEYTLTGFMISGEFPETSSLWELPIAIYDKSGNVRYYEYRVVSEQKTIGAIVCNANEKMGAPIAFVLHKESYADEIEDLYNQGIFSKNELPRIIDNGYPNIVIAGTKLRPEGGINYKTAYDMNTGNSVDEIATSVSFEDYIKEYPDVLSESQKKEIVEAIENYKKEINDMWILAKQNKGNIITRGWWGGKSSGNVNSTYFPNAMTIEDFEKDYHRHPDSPYSKRRKLGYYACGGSAAGYILDTLALNGIGKVSEKWLKMDNIKQYPKTDCALHLIEIMDMSYWGKGQYVTWPGNIGDAISKYSEYKTIYNLGIPKKSVDNGIPGISLKMAWYGNAISMHYRNVVAYEARGWGIFKWDFELIRDINYLDDGQWEAVNPFVHWMSWNVQPK